MTFRLQSSVIALPKYTNCRTCSTLWPFIVIFIFFPPVLHTLITFVFLVSSSRSRLMFCSVRLLSFGAQHYYSTPSPDHQQIARLSPTIRWLKVTRSSVFSKASSISCWIILNNSGDSGQPCLTPRPNWHASEWRLFILMTTDWFL